jgi:hypothetical protein
MPGCRHCNHRRIVTRMLISRIQFQPEMAVTCPPHAGIAPRIQSGLSGFASELLPCVDSMVICAPFNPIQ